jgi:hypothetical protein
MGNRLYVGNLSFNAAAAASRPEPVLLRPSSMLRVTLRGTMPCFALCAS